MLVRSGHHPDQVLVLDHRRGAASALHDAHPRSAQAVEAQPDGRRVAQPLGAIHQGQGSDAGAHPHPRSAVVGGRGRRQEEGAAELHRAPARTNSLPEIQHDPVVLPARVRNPDYHRGPIRPKCTCRRAIERLRAYATRAAEYHSVVGARDARRGPRCRTPLFRQAQPVREASACGGCLPVHFANASRIDVAENSWSLESPPHRLSAGRSSAGW